VPSGEDIRFWPVGRYLIVYRAHEDGIRVIRILSGQWDVTALLD
jgi:plasmid stabilization system protein ParE